VAKCPVCSANLKDDFGLIECAQCGAALVVELDGTIKSRDAVSPMSMELPPMNTSDGPTGMVGGVGGGMVGTKTMVVSPTGVSLGGMSEVQPDSQFQSEGDGAPAPPVLMAELAVAPSGLGELSDFGNSEASAARDGAYSYDVSITGIDSSDVRQAVRELLSDKFFLWDAEVLIRSISDGELSLREISPVKAAVLIQRLNGLPIQVKWVQHALATS
jgi:hypothetical protein